jgi:prepilin-type N-terminal cleavage/methylation domain-containing protein
MKNQKGFTLTEILIVMVVAGILLALILPNTLRAIERANVTAVRNDLNSIDSALFMCYSEERNWANCNTLAALQAPVGGGNPYMVDLPMNPFDGTAANPGDGYALVGNNVAGWRAAIVGGLTLPQDLMDDITNGKILEQ